MSGTDTWVGAGGASLSGSWGTASNWTPASVPSAGTNAEIGFGITASTPWTVTVAGAGNAADNLFLGMGAEGTLDITGTLNVAGSVDGTSPLSGATGDIIVGSGAALTGAGDALFGGGSVMVAGGTVSFADGFSDLQGAAVQITAGGQWNTSEFFVGPSGTSHVTVAGSGSKITAEAVDVGNAGRGIGTLDVGAGALVAATGTLTEQYFSAISINSGGAVVVGSGASVAGAMVIQSSASLAFAILQGNVVDSGTLSVGVIPSFSGEGISTIEGAVTGSGAINVAQGAELVVTGSFAPTGTISMAGGTLDLQGVTFTAPGTYTPSTGLLVAEGLTLDVGAGKAVGAFTVTADAGAGTLITEAPCYVAGTRIATEHGEVTVEKLQPGDRVRTAEGRLAPVAWVGRTAIDLAALAYPAHRAPIRIAAGAFGPRLPRRDLLVSPDHALFHDGALIPARKLVNGATIRQEVGLQQVSYVHVELDRHDLMLAEGLAAESFLDTGNRAQLDPTSGERLARLDQDPVAAVRQIYAARGCAPLVLEGAAVEAAHAALVARARTLGWTLVEDAGLRVTSEVGTPIVLPDGPRSWLVVAPAGARTLRIQSRSFIATMFEPGSDDGRQLGLALGVELYGAALPDAAFGKGWHAPDAGAEWRWTDGDAVLHLPAESRRAVVSLHNVLPVQYWAAPTLARARAA